MELEHKHNIWFEYVLPVVVFVIIIALLAMLMATIIGGLKELSL